MEAPLYEFGYGLSYTTFSTSVSSLLAYDGATHATITVRNTGSKPADTAILAFLRYVGPSATAGPGARTTIGLSGCSIAARSTDLVRRLVGYQRIYHFYHLCAYSLRARNETCDTDPQETAWD